MVPRKRGSSATIAAASGRCGLVSIARPSASSVSRSSPQRTVKRYDFRPSITNGTVLVASPSAIGRQPDASGSSVPAWPARLAQNSRLTIPTANVEVMPTGLSMMTQPWTSCFSGLREAPGASIASMLAIGPSGEIALDRGRPQQSLDPFRLAESLVDAEADVGREFEIHLLGDRAAHVALVAVERRQDLRLVAPAERHHVDGRQPQIGAHADFRHGDQMRLDHGVMNLALRQQLGHGMTHGLADAQLALRGAACRRAMLSAGHFIEPRYVPARAGGAERSPIDLVPISPGQDERRPKFRTLERALHRLHPVALDGIAGAHVLEILERHAAFLAGTDLARVVLEVLELRELALVDHHVVADEPHVGAALDRAVGHAAAGDLADFRHVEDLEDLRVAQRGLAQRRRQEPRHRLLHVVDEIVDDVVVADLDSGALGGFARLLVGAHVAAADS